MRGPPKTLRSRHGNARKYGVGPVVEVLPFDEQPAGLADPNAAPTPARNALGHYQAGHPATVAAAQAAGRARHAWTTLGHTLGVASQDPEWRKLLGQAEAFRRAQVRELRDNVGGGKCGPAPASLVASAALALAGSRLAYARGELELGSRLAAEVRQHLLGANELCAREAQARPRTKTPTAARLEAMRASAAQPLTTPTETDTP